MILPEMLMCAALLASPGLSPFETSALRADIATRFDRDQSDLRPETFSQNLDWLLATSARVGWFDVPRFGWRTASQAGIMLKHGATDPRAVSALACILPALARVYLESPFAEAYAVDLDGYLAAVGAPQVYGTQMEPASDGVYETMPVRDPCSVDERRGEIGMLPLWVYVEELSEAYGEPAYAGGGT